MGDMRSLVFLSLFATACVSRTTEGALRVVWGADRQPALLGLAASGWGRAEGTSVVALPSEEIVVAGVLDHSKSGVGLFEVPDGSPTSFVARLSRDGDVLWRLRLLTCQAPVHLAAAGDDAIYVSVLGLLALGEDEVQEPILNRHERCLFGAQEASRKTLLRLDGLGRVTWRVEVPGRPSDHPTANNAPLQLLATPERVLALGRTALTNQSLVFSLTREGKTEWSHTEDGLLAASAWLLDGNLVSAGNEEPRATSGAPADQPDPRRSRCFLRAFDVKTGERLWDRPLETKGARCQARQVSVTKTDVVFWGVDLQERAGGEEKSPNSLTAQTWFAASVAPETGALRWQRSIDRDALAGPLEQDRITLAPEELIFEGEEPLGHGGRQPLFLGIDARTGQARKVASLRAEPVKLEHERTLGSAVDVKRFDVASQALWAVGSFVGRVSFSGRTLDSPYAYRWHCNVNPAECAQDGKTQTASFALFVSRIPLRRQ
jgi:outer membrane protein assembly factor BamB